MKALVVLLPTDNINVDKLSLDIGDYLANRLNTESQIITFNSEEIAQLLVKNRIEVEDKKEPIIIDPILVIIETILRELPNSSNLANFGTTESTIWISDLVFRYLSDKNFHSYMIQNRSYIRDFLYDERVIKNTKNSKKYIKLRAILKPALESIHFFD
jgi:hypothetical protein